MLPFYQNLLFIRLSRLYYCLKLLYYTLFTHFTPLPSSSSRQTRYLPLRDNINPLSAVRSHDREASARSQAAFRSRLPLHINCSECVLRIAKKSSVSPTVNTLRSFLISLEITVLICLAEFLISKSESIAFSSKSTSIFFEFLRSLSVSSVTTLSAFSSSYCSFLSFCLT